MKYFENLEQEQLGNLFYKRPCIIDRDCEREVISYALGPALYMPAIRDGIAEDIINKKHSLLNTIIICFEDSIGDNQVEEAEKKLLNNLCKIEKELNNGTVDYDSLPFIFIRVRDYLQIKKLYSVCKHKLKLINGFVFPKFSVKNGEKFFEEFIDVSDKLGKKLYAMPIFETSEFVYKETRMKNLINSKRIIDKYKDIVVNIRIGVTDFSNYYAIRRTVDTTIYDVHIIRDCISDIVNLFGFEGNYTISGTVCEFFSNNDRVLKPKLRQSPFVNKYGKSGMSTRHRIVDEYIDCLIYEVLLDKVNGFIGKTIIHPSHILPVLSLQVVSFEDYKDSKSIIECNDGKVGVLKSYNSNKMNEVKPHLNWAKKVQKLSNIYGVLNEDYDFTSILRLEKYNRRLISIEN